MTALTVKICKEDIKII